MNTITITQKAANKHLDYHQIEYVISSIRDFEIQNKGKKRNIGKTEFMKKLASNVGTTLSNIYRLRDLAEVELIDSDFKPYKTYSVEAVVNRFEEGRARPNSLKIDKAGEFIDEVTRMVRKKHKGGDFRYDLTSIDEAVNSRSLIILTAIRRNAACAPRQSTIMCIDASFLSSPLTCLGCHP